MKVILLDAYNMIHRCRFNFGGGKTDLEGWSLFYNFNRLVRATIEEYNPDKMYFVLDGKPVQRLEKFAHVSSTAFFFFAIISRVVLNSIRSIGYTMGRFACNMDVDSC